MTSRNQREGWYLGHGNQSDHRPGHYRTSSRALSLKGFPALQRKAMDQGMRIKEVMRETSVLNTHADVVKKLGDR